MRFIIVISMFTCLLFNPTSANEALNLLNQYRVAVGLIPLGNSQELTRSAANHVRYLSQFGKDNVNSFNDAHEEHSSVVGFTGKTVADRVEYVGYAHRHVSENISIGSKTVDRSIELLMSGIYHRFGFLDFSIDELGMATFDRIYVYNMGRNDIAQTCIKPPEDALALQPRDCLGTTVKPAFWDNICNSISEDEVFQSPYPRRCPNGTLLDKTYMEKLCANPPAKALLTGSGKYYNICGSRHKIKASWLDRLCDSPSVEAIYPGDGRYYTICDDEHKVHAFWLEAACESVEEKDKYTDSGKYYNSCTTAEHKIRKEYFDELDHKRHEANPAYVVWPASGMKDVDTSFYSEIPDPVPDLGVTGYPFSLQFNPGKTKKIEILSVDLSYPKGSDWEKVENLRELNSKSDPHKKLSDLEFAWFPLKPLKTGTEYRVKIKAKIDSKVETIEWKFTTESFFSHITS